MGIFFNSANQLSHINCTGKLLLPHYLSVVIVHFHICWCVTQTWPTADGTGDRRGANVILAGVRLTTMASLLVRERFYKNQQVATKQKRERRCADRSAGVLKQHETRSEPEALRTTHTRALNWCTASTKSIPTQSSTLLLHWQEESKWNKHPYEHHTSKNGHYFRTEAGSDISEVLTLIDLFCLNRHKKRN